MKHTTKKIAFLALTLALMLIFTACSKVDKKVVATVGQGENKQEITLTQLTNYYSNYTTNMSYYGYSFDDMTDEERLETVKNLLDQLIESSVEIYKAKEAQSAGTISLTAEEQKEAEEAAAADYDSLFQQFVSYAEQQGASDTNAQALKLLTNMLVESGSTVKKTKAEYLESEINSKLVEKNKAKVMEGKEATEEVLRGLYEEEVASQTETITDTASYFTQEMYADYGYGYPAFVIPEGLFYVRHILVEDEETAKEIKAKIDAGEDFETLLKEHNTDTGEDAYPEGYVCGEGASFVTEFLEAALALKEGEVSEPVKSEYGYHIIKRLGDVPAGTKTFEEAGETFTATAAETYETEQYDAIVDGWVAEEGMVTIDEAAYADVGK